MGDRAPRVELDPRPLEGAAAISRSLRVWDGKARGGGG